MADYIYLLQNRLTRAQQTALAAVRDAARSHSVTVFLVGGAVRDLSSGAPVRDLDVAVQGDATALQKELEAAGGALAGSNDTMQSLYFTFAGGVRMEVSSTIAVTFPEPGKPVVTRATIQEDLRRRDFTANAMAISLNEGSHGLLMDPLNGIADTENRELRLVSNYGFIEDPARLIRAERLAARLGWQMEEKTAQRYQTAKAEEYISALSPWARSYELEEVFHEEEPLRVLRRLEAEGWMTVLFPAFSSAKANETELERVRDLIGQLEAMGIVADPSGVNFPLLTGKLGEKDVADLKASFARPGFVRQIESLDESTKAFAGRFSAKDAAAPSAAWNLLMTAPPEQVLSLAFGSRSNAIQTRFKAFFNEWPTARQRLPHQLMQEMRITPELPQYEEVVEKLFFAIMDGKLDTQEATREFLAPYSPPAPAPLATVRRRPAKRESKSSKSRAKQPSPATTEGEGDSSSPPPAEAGAVKQRPDSGPAASKSPAKSAGESNGAAAGGAARAAAPTAASAKKTDAKPAEKTASAVAATSSPSAATKSATAKSVPATEAAAKATPAKTAASKPLAAKAVPAKGSPAKASPAKSASASPPAGSGTKAAAKKVAGKSLPSVPAKAQSKAAPSPAPRPAAKGAAKQSAKAALPAAKRASSAKSAQSKTAATKASGTKAPAKPGSSRTAKSKAPAKSGAPGRKR